MNSSQSIMYNQFAALYDAFYALKDYEQEVHFIKSLLPQTSFPSLLDVGCGTGNHLSKLEAAGYLCQGIDMNEEQVAIAKTKVKGVVRQRDMRSFHLEERFDAIVLLFAVFNHLLDRIDALLTLRNLHLHLKKNGVLLLDLYNPQASGEKTQTVGPLTKTMSWTMQPGSSLCMTKVQFQEGTHPPIEEDFPLQIYPPDEMKALLTEAGFQVIALYNGFSLETGSSASKNLLILARKG